MPSATVFSVVLQIMQEKKRSNVFESSLPVQFKLNVSYISFYSLTSSCTLFKNLISWSETPSL